MRKRVGKSKERQGLVLARQGNALVVKDNVTAERAGELLNRVKAFRLWWKELWDKPIRTAKAAWEANIEARNKLDAPLEQVERRLKGQLYTFNQQLQQQQRKEQQRLEQQATRDALAQRERQAKQLERSGEKKQAQQIRKAPLVLPPIVATVPAPNLKDISFRHIWRFRILDEKLVPPEYCCPDLKKISRVVEALKGEARIPGIEVYAEGNVGAGIGAATDA